jgi:hypothetical protein
MIAFAQGYYTSHSSQMEGGCEKFFKVSLSQAAQEPSGCKKPKKSSIWQKLGPKKSG